MVVSEGCTDRREKPLGPTPRSGPSETPRRLSRNPCGGRAQRAAYVQCWIIEPSTHTQKVVSMSYGPWPQPLGFDV